jgi:hypothetical protein
MALKYNNQLKISLSRYQLLQLEALTQLHGVTKQDILRKALDAFVKEENDRLLRSNPHARPLPGM